MSENHPLIEAAKNGEFEEVQRRVNAGESPDTRGTCLRVYQTRNFTPLMVASCNGHTDVVEFLISQGASVDAQQSYGTTPLMYAAGNNHTQICVILLKNGAKLDIQSNLGSTALHLACSGGHSHSVALLLSHGARTDIKDREGKTALDFARKFNQTECVELITQHENHLRTQRSLRALCVAECTKRVSITLSRLPRHLQVEILTLRQ